MIETKNIRAYNVQEGDSLAFFNQDRMCEHVATVTDTKRDYVGDGSVTISFKFNDDPQTYKMNMKRASLIRVCRGK